MKLREEPRPSGRGPHGFAVVNYRSGLVLANLEVGMRTRLDEVDQELLSEPLINQYPGALRASDMAFATSKPLALQRMIRIFPWHLFARFKRLNRLIEF